MLLSVLLVLCRAMWLRSCCDQQVKQYDTESEKRLLETPDLNKYVFCQVLADCGQVRAFVGVSGRHEYDMQRLLAG